jgi:hypothetical protein
VVPGERTSDFPINIKTALYNITEKLHCEEDELRESDSTYTCQLKDKPSNDCGGSSQADCNLLPSVGLIVHDMKESLDEWERRFRTIMM